MQAASGQAVLDRLGRESQLKELIAPKNVVLAGGQAPRTTRLVI
jgi:hypothetical protein